MIEKLEELRATALKELAAINGGPELEAWRVRYLGRKSELTSILRSLATLTIEERKTAGSVANSVRVSLESSFDEKKQPINVAQLPKQASSQRIDISLPGRPLPAGRLHPITQTIHEICDIFGAMGFQIVEGPEVEWDYYNFEALNLGKEHPGRDNFATLYSDYESKNGERNMLLRTHTTSVTARTLETMKPPIRVIEPGRVYRYEASDATHGSMFYQIDAIAVDKATTMPEKKGPLYGFPRRFFGEDRKVRFRCDFFPFVEPGAEMAIECGVCHGAGCRLCKNSGWIEVLGAGMTHPDVLRRGGIDPDVYGSFAFGIGIERLPMLKYGIDDIRLFYGR